MGVVFVLLLASVAIVLFVLEWFRPREQGTLPNISGVVQKGPRNIAVEDSKPRSNGDKARDLDGFVAKVKEKYRAMHERYVALEHEEICVAEELAQTGHPTNGIKTVERVWFEGDQERRQLLAHEQSDSNVMTSDATSPPKSKILYPFYREDVPGTYRYFWEEVEEVDGRRLVRLRFEPLPPLSDKMTGYVWADAVTGQPCRFDGLLAKPSPLVDHFRMIAYYEPSENGEYQLRRMVTEGSGGFAFIRRRFRKTFEYSGYRPRSP